MFEVEILIRHMVKKKKVSWVKVSWVNTALGRFFEVFLNCFSIFIIANKF